MESEKKRCPWCLDFDQYINYHDKEWGVPSYDDNHQFEMLILEGMQAGLSWATILKKRDHFRNEFDGFDPDKMARYDESKIEKLLEDRKIIRNRLKIESAVTNARVYLNIRERYDSFSDYMWQFVNGEPIVNTYNTLDEIPAKTKESENMSKKLKKDGFKFVGPTICYAHMQATGMVNDHLTDCFRYEELREWSMRQ